MPNVQPRSLTIRLPETVYRAARRIAEREGISLNRLVADALTDKARRSTARRLKAAYDALGRNRSETDVERYVSVQAEALLDG